MTESSSESAVNVGCGQPCDCGRVLADDEHHCWFHHADENPDGAFIVCGECWHVYRTAADLEVAYERAIAEMGLPPHYKDAADIFFCQECIHDF